MRVYGKDDLKKLLQHSGFKAIGFSVHKSGWLCATATAGD
jgi:hypothetical protein